MCVLLKIRAPKGGFCSDAIEEPFLVPQPLKGVVNFKKAFAENLLTPMTSKMSTSFFLQSKRN